MFNLSVLKEKINHFAQEHKEELGRVRREVVLEDMFSREEEGYHCRSCVGHCCHYEFNSMMVSPIEAFEMLFYLMTKERLTEKLVDELTKNAKDFHLNRELWQGNQLLRRYYTCPFYAKEKLGCTIGPNFKPYGCLAFNSKEKDVTSPGHCGTRKEALIKREKENIKRELELNQMIKEIYKLDWDKKPISTALLHLMEVFL